MRARVMTLAGLLAGGCFTPPGAGGLPCGPTLSCPGDQVCSLDGVCVRIGADAGAGDGPDGGDRDADGVADAVDNCAAVANPGQADEDDDRVGDSCDLCPMVYDPEQANVDGDGVSDPCDPGDETYDTPLRFWGFSDREVTDPAGLPAGGRTSEGALQVQGDGAGVLAGLLPSDQGGLYLFTAAEVRGVGLSGSLSMGLLGEGRLAVCSVRQEPAGLMLAAQVDAATVTSTPAGVLSWGTPSGLLLQTTLGSALGCVARFDNGQQAGPVLAGTMPIPTSQVVLGGDGVEARLAFVYVLASRAP